MILTAGHNYVKLNYSNAFLNFMNQHMPGSGNQPGLFAYASGEDFGYPGQTGWGYPFHWAHFNTLPPYTIIKNITDSWELTKYNDYRADKSPTGDNKMMLFGTGPTFTDPYGHMSTWFAFDKEYDIMIPTRNDNEGIQHLPFAWGNGTLTEYWDLDYNQSFRHDFVEAAAHFDSWGVGSNYWNSAELDFWLAFKFTSPYLIHIEERQRRIASPSYTCRSTGYDTALFSPPEDPDTESYASNGFAYHSFYYVYGGEPMNVNDHPDIMHHTPASGVGIYEPVGEGALGSIWNIDAHGDQGHWGLSGQYYHTYSHNVAGIWGNQTPPGICQIKWLGHTAGFQGATSTNAQESPWNTADTEASFDKNIFNRDLVGPSFNNPPANIADGWHCRLPSMSHGQYEQIKRNEALDEVFLNSGNVMVRDFSLDSGTKVPQVQFISDTNQPTAAYPSGGPMRFDVTSGDGYYTDTNAQLFGTQVPGVILQPGNIYRIDIRFAKKKVGGTLPSTIDLGPDFARLFYSDDPIGNTGWLGEDSVPDGNRSNIRQGLEFFPYLRDGGKENFALTSWKDNLNSSIALYGNVVAENPQYFEDYNKHNEGATPDFPYGILNAVDTVYWSQMGRSDIAQKIIDMITGQAPYPPTRNPVYLEDFDLVGRPEEEGLNQYGTYGDGVLGWDDYGAWSAIGNTAVCNVLLNFIQSGNGPPSRADIDPDGFVGGVFNLSGSMDGDYTTQLIQSGQMDTPDYVFENLPSLPLQPWGLRYFEDFKAFNVQGMTNMDTFVSHISNALVSWPAETYMSATMEDDFSDVLGGIISEDGLAKYRGITGQWIGALDVLEAGKYYDIKLKSDITQPYIFRNKFIENSSEHGPHTIVLAPNQWHTIRYAPVNIDEDITFNQDDLLAWEQVGIDTGEYVGHVKDWIKRYLSIREGGYNTNITTFNTTYLPRSPSGNAEFGPLKSGYEPALSMGEYPLLPHGLAYYEDTGAWAGMYQANVFVNLGYSELGDWLATFLGDPNNYNNMPPNSGDGAPKFGPLAIQYGFMNLLSSHNNPQLKNALGSNFYKRSVNSTWDPVEGQVQQFPFSSGSYAVEHGYEVEDVVTGGPLTQVPLDSSFVLFGSQPTGDGDFTINNTYVAVYYKGTTNTIGTNSIVSGWYCPNNSPIFDDGIVLNKPFYIQHQLPYSIYYINDRLDISNSGMATVSNASQFKAYNFGIVPAGEQLAGSPYVELPPRVATKIYFKPISGEEAGIWYGPGQGTYAPFNEWMYDDELPVLRQGYNYKVPYRGTTPRLLDDNFLNHIAFPKGQVVWIQEEPEFNENGTYANVDDIANSNPFSTHNQNWPYRIDGAGVGQPGTWFGELTEFKPGRTYRIGVAGIADGVVWPFFGKESDVDFFPTQPVGIDEWIDMDIDGDGIISIDDWTLWKNPPSGPARDDIADYIQDYLTIDEWRIFYTSPPIESDPIISEMINLEDMNISLLSSDGQPKTDISEVEVSKNYFNGNSSTLNGSDIFTASLETSNKDYYLRIMDGHTTSSKSDYVFSVAYGHYQGSGSYVGTNKKGTSEGVYKQHLSVLEDVSKLEKEGEPGKDESIIRGFNIGSGSGNRPVGVANIDDYVYIISFDRKRFGDKLKTGHWVLNLSGSAANGAGKTLSLTDDSQVRNAINTPAGPRYNIVSGSKGDIQSTNTNGEAGAIRGWFYPHQGTMVLSEYNTNFLRGPSAAANISGSATGSVARFSHTDGNIRLTSSGFFISPTQNGDKDYRNSLRLVNMMRNVDGSVFDGLQGVEEQTSVTYMCNIKPHQLNFSNNPTYTSYIKYTSATEQDFQPFFNMRNTQFHGDPQTYITQVNLHDVNGGILAVGKLSTPLNKNFEKEAMIKVKLTY